MNEVENYISLELEFKDNRIINILDLNSKKVLNSFSKPLTGKGYKLYIIKSNKEFLYIGITRQSLRNRFRLGFKAEGKNGYHGYKWKNIKCVQLFVWIFESCNETQLENIEAELTYLVRNKTNSWPLFQNEIHFNNKFKDGRKIASQIFEFINKE
ncbi:MAG: GIY-YIG nuclease family protein [bacterium]